jgi:pSer/pThr/pTyr-binding forkhead associated (FHA) protein
MHTDHDYNTYDDQTITGRPDFANSPEWEETVDAENSTHIQEIVHAQIQGNLLKHHSLLTFNIGGIQLFSTLDEEIIFGRSADQSFDKQIIDLSGFKAHEAGVSRQHAALQRNENNQIVLIDLDSSNGTFLNGERLIPMHAYLVENGDEIGLAHLTLIIDFDSA